MASVYRKTYTKPMPEGAETFTRKGQQYARWKDGTGKTKTAKLTTGRDGSERIVQQAATYTASYRDGQDLLREVATGCRDETAARQVLADLVKRAEQVRSGIISTDEDTMASHQQASLADHLEAYLAHLRAKGVTAGRIKTNKQRFLAVAGDCRFAKLSDLSGDALERWLSTKAEKKMSAGSRNGYREACVGFGNWCVRTRRLSSNPFASVPKANAKADCRRKRRALTEEELVKLLAVADRRPLLEAMTIRRGEKAGKPLAKVRNQTKQRLERLGHERALIYKTLVLTGLRKAELASLTVGQLDLGTATPTAALNAADEKNRRGSTIQLRDDLAADLRQWLAEKLRLAQDEARGKGEAIPMRLAADVKLFTVPAGLVRILNRDLEMAGIPKKDDRGRTVDVHALRHTMGTHLSKGNVPPRTAQMAMRHSSIDLTMNVYTDPRLLDVRKALDALPDLPLGERESGAAQKATGTDGADPEADPLAVLLAVACDDSGKSSSNAGKATRRGKPDGRSRGRSQVPSLTKEERPLPSADKGRPNSEREDLNLRPLRPERSALSKLSYAPV